MGTFSAIKNKNQSAKDMNFTIQYMLDKAKTFHNGVYLNSGVNCSVPTVFFEMMTTKNRYRKPDKRMFYQFVQSFPSDTKLSAQQVHSIGLAFAQKQFPQFEVLVSTHCNTKNLHNHILVNSVSYETGKKLHQNHDNLLEHRQVNDEICLRFGEQILKPYIKGQKNKSIKTREYRSALKGNSWKMQMSNTIDDCMKFAQSKEHFIYLMASEGYTMTWTDSRKNITFINNKGNKSRDNSLHEDKYLKENLENEFRIRESFFGRIKTAKPSTDDSHTADTNCNEQKLDYRKSSDTDGIYQQRYQQPSNYTQDNFGYGATSRSFEQDDFNTKTSKQLVDSERFTEDIHTTDGTENNVTTGWETERETLFYGKIQTAKTDATKPKLELGSNADNLGVGDIVATTIGIATATDVILNDVTVTPKKVYITDKKALAKTKQRKIAHGHKADDHEEEQNFEITMY